MRTIPFLHRNCLRASPCWHPHGQHAGIAYGDCGCSLQASSVGTRLTDGGMEKVKTYCPTPSLQGIITTVDHINSTLKTQYTLAANRKSHTGFRLAPILMTLNNLERQSLLSKKTHSGKKTVRGLKISVIHSSCINS